MRDSSRVKTRHEVCVRKIPATRKEQRNQQRSSEVEKPKKMAASAAVNQAQYSSKTQPWRQPCVRMGKGIAEREPRSGTETQPSLSLNHSSAG
jgi:hypothetical protein